MITISKLIAKFENYKTTDAYKEDDMYFDHSTRIAVYEEEHGQGYILDVEMTDEVIGFDVESVTACYYWFENGQLKSEPFDFWEVGQYARHIEAGHHVIYDTMYFVPNYK